MWKLMKKAKSLLRKINQGKKNNSVDEPIEEKDTSDMRKTFEVSVFVERMNNLLKDTEIPQIQKEAICGIVEGILEYTHNKYSCTMNNNEEFSRTYTIN